MDFAWKYVDAFYTACSTFGIDWDIAPVDGTTLDCDSVITGTGVLGYYHIEWKLNSPTQEATTVFTSGVTLDPGEVQMQHPFSDPQPVQAGDLYPVFKYIYIDGVRYSAYRDDVGRWSPDLLTCLDHVTISPWTCYTSYGGDPVYQIKWTYNNLTDLADNKSRVFTYEVCPNQVYIAWEFTTYAVADQIRLYYCTYPEDPGTLIDNFIIGFEGVTVNLSPANYPTNPRYYYWYNSYTTGVKFITDLNSFEYAAGNFVKVVITGSVLEPTETNTNWILKLQYLTAADIDCSLFDHDFHHISDTPTDLVWTGDPTCRYSTTYNTTVAPGATYVSKTSASAQFLFKYTQLTMLNGSSPIAVFSSNPVGKGVSWSTTFTTSYVVGSGVYSCDPNFDNVGTITISKTVDDMTYTFSENTMYNHYKSDITAIQASSYYTTWLGLSDTDMRYYAVYRVSWWVANTCGDSISQYYHSYHLSSTITTNDTNRTVTFTFEIPTNNLPDIGDCDNTHEGADQMINSMTYTRDFTIGVGTDHTHILTQTAIGMVWAYPYVYGNPINLGYSHAYVEEIMLNNICDPSDYGWWRTYFMSGRGYQYIMYRCYDRLTLTDTTDHASRLANWRLERSVAMRTDDVDDLGSWEIIREEP